MRNCRFDRVKAGPTRLVTRGSDHHQSRVKQSLLSGDGGAIGHAGTVVPPHSSGISLGLRVFAFRIRLVINELPWTAVRCGKALTILVLP